MVTVIGSQMGGSSVCVRSGQRQRLGMVIVPGMVIESQGPRPRVRVTASGGRGPE